MLKLPFVYLAGPITKPDPLRNTGAAMAAWNNFHDTGKCVMFLPHLSSFLDMHCPREHQEWLDYDFQVILRCDALFRLEGESKGADMEVAFCQQHNIPVFDDFFTFMEWCENWIKENNKEVSLAAA